MCLFIITCIGISADIAAAIDLSKNQIKVEFERAYDSRIFLSTTQVRLFNKFYPQFDEKKLEKDWEWKDVDPLALFTPEENRKRRREMFLYEHSPNTLLPTEGEPTQDQLAFKTVLQTRFPEAVILITSKTVKLVSRYEPSYDDLPTLRNLNKLPDPKSMLELTADLGLQWSIFGGQYLYIYNGPILITRFKSGYVNIADPNIDRPKTKRGN